MTDKELRKLRRVELLEIRLYVNSWGGIHENPTPFLTSEPFLYTALIHPVFGHAK
ncbi:hypothetical protein [Brotaphodocola sp.]|uniref:hypothetical protein n=1 Tax=Brotaphodocola sp. TaxID=3073577 RepID=UPI003D7EEC83